MCDLILETGQWTIDFEQIRPHKGKGAGKSYDERIDKSLKELCLIGSKSDDIKDFYFEGSFYVQRFSIHIWDNCERFYESRVHNVIAKKIPSQLILKHNLFEKSNQVGLEVIHPCPVDSFCQFPVDFVYTWVNNRDPNWQELYRRHAPEALKTSSESVSMDRFYNRDELKYSLRSVEKFAPWVRKVYIVTNCAPPDWLDLDHEKIVFVDHEEIFDESELPTFNSHAIESKLHHISGLSTHFVYFNDDMFLGRKTVKEDFFLSNGTSASVLESYGMVNGDLNKKDPDYLNAARNGKQLIEGRFLMTPTQLHTHSPYCLNTNVLDEMERHFKTLFKETGASRFRSINDISVVSFFYHHYAYHIGKSYRKKDKTVLLKRRSANMQKRIKEIRSFKCLSFCINDGNASSGDPDWDNIVTSLLMRLFPDRSSFEKKN